MKFVRCLIVVLSVLLFAGCSTPRAPVIPVEVGPPIEKPAVFDDTWLTVTVSDLHGFLDGAGTIAESISPTLNGAVFKAVLGTKLGDPQLTGFAPGKGLSVVVINDAILFAVLEVEPLQTAGYVAGIQAMGLRAKEADGVVLAAVNSEQMAYADQFAARVRSDLLEKKRSPAIRIALQPADQIAKNEDLIASGIEAMLTQMKQASGSNDVGQVDEILEAELQFLLSMGRQIEAVEVEIEPVDGSTHVRKLIEPVAGSRLSALCNAPVLRDFNPKVQSGELTDGAIQVEFNIRNPEACITFLSGECAALSESMQWDPAKADLFVDYTERWMNVLGGTVCESILTGPGKEIGLGYLAEVKDEAGMLELLREIHAEFEAMGLIGFYESMGLSLSLEFVETVRQHAGVSIHQLKMDVGMETLRAEQRDALELMMNQLTYEIARVDDLAIYTTGASEMERVIDRLKDPAYLPTPLAARAVFPAGAFYYADFDLGQYVSFAVAFMEEFSNQPQTVQPLDEMLAGLDPIMLAGFCNNGRIQADARVPGGLWARVISQTMSMLNAVRQQNAPQQQLPPMP